MARSARPLDIRPITTRVLDVLRVTDVTPGMRRVTLGGDQLRAFRSDTGFDVAAFESTGFDDDVKIILRHPELEKPLAPTQGDGTLVWPRDPRMLARTYTVRRWDEAKGEVDIDFVKHGSGPATSWAYRAQPGQRIQIAGPKMSWRHPQGVDWLLVAGDETALPSIGRWIEEFPDDVRAQVFVEIADDSHRQTFDVGDGVELTWLSRNGAPAGTTDLLLDAVRSAAWWDGTPFAWIAGESTSIAPIRRWLRTEKKLPIENVEIVGYWRRQGDAPESVAGELPEAGEPAQEEHHDGALEHHMELVPAFALRVAITVGLFGALSQDEPRSLAHVASATRTDERGLFKLLRYLAELDAVRITDTGYLLTEEGSELDEEYYEEQLSLESGPGRRELGVLALLSAVRTGKGDYASWFGADFLDLLRADPTALQASEINSDLVVETLAKSHLFDSARTLVVNGRSAGAYAGALVDARSDLTVTVAAHPSELAAITAVHGERDRVVLEPSSLLEVRADRPDGILLLSILDTAADEDAVHILRQAARSVSPDGAVFLFGEPLDLANAGEYDYAEDLLDYSVFGGGRRDNTEYEKLFATAGLTVTDRVTIGWGEILFRLVART